MSKPAFAPSCASALERLAHCHEHTRALADECRRVARHVGDDRGLQQVAEALCQAIHRMAALEEELFFPAARAALQASSLVDLAELEHATARQIIAQMRATDPRAARYEALVVALGDCVERHARHERGELFPRLRESCVDLAALGERLDADADADRLRGAGRAMSPASGRPVDAGRREQLLPHPACQPPIESPVDTVSGISPQDASCVPPKPKEYTPCPR